VTLGRALPFTPDTASELYVMGTNIAMRGTDSAALAATALTNATWTDARAGYLDELAAANLPADIDGLKTTTTLIVADTNELQTNQGNWLTSTLTAADVWAYALHAATTARTMVLETWASTANANQEVGAGPSTVYFYADDGVTTLVTRTIAADGLSQTKD